MSPDCDDQHGDCGYWANHGQCQANPGYMLVNCALSCGQCTTEDEDDNNTEEGDAGEQELIHYLSCSFTPEWLIYIMYTISKTNVHICININRFNGHSV